MSVPNVFDCTLALEISNSDRTHALAGVIAGLCNAGDCLLLRGDLGVGKTSFARGFIGALCDHAGEVVSPTFTLVQTYRARDGRDIAHFDLYRLEKPQEIVEIGLEDALQNGICLIEWPQLIEACWPPNALLIDMEYGPKEQARAWVLCGKKEFWQARLEKIKMATA
jgi:tRNA threonylcarbamoyl adenosine modification protein YjeE